MPLLQFGEYRPDVSDYEGATTKTILNVIPRGDGYGPFPGESPYTGSLPAACRGAFYALKSDGSVITFAGTETKLYKLNNTDYTWDDVSKAAGSYSLLTSNAQWRFAQTGNLVFATQANDLLQVFDLSSSTEFDDALGSPPQAAYIDVVGRFIVLSGLLSNPFRIQWSGLNDFNSSNSWTSGVNSSDYQDFPDGGIVRGVAGGEFGTVFQDQAIRRMTYVPGSPVVFQIDRISQDKGLLAPYSIIRAGELVFFFSSHGFQKISPGGFPEPIGRERVDRTIQADLDYGNLQLFIGASDPRSSRIYWSYKSVDGQAGLYDKIIGYDFALDRFFPIEVTGEYLLGISQTGITLESLDSISSSIDDMVLTFDAYPASVRPETAHFNSDHKLSFFRGDSLEASLETSEQGTDGRRIYVGGFRPVTDAGTVYGSIAHRDKVSDTPTDSSEVAKSSRTGKCNLRNETRYARFKVRIPAAESWTFCAGVEPDIKQVGFV